MKKIIALAFALTCFFSLVSCEGEDDTNYVQKNYLAGMYRVTQIGALNASNILNYTDVPSASCSDTYQFNEDMTFVITDFTMTDDVCSSATISGTYKIVSGNIELTITGMENPVVLDMLTLTDKELNVVYTDSNTSKLVFLKMARQMVVATN